LSPRTYAISGLTFSVLDQASPASSAPFTHVVAGRTFSILNGTAPSASFRPDSSVARRPNFLRPVSFGFIAEALDRGADRRDGKPVCTDSDGDGLCDSDELILGTNPFRADTDGDGYPDALELLLGSDPLNPGRIPDFRPPGYVTPAASIQDTKPIARLTTRRQGAIHAKNNP